jgi:hypothetical protein
MLERSGFLESHQADPSILRLAIQEVPIIQALKKFNYPFVVPQVLESGAEFPEVRFVIL